MNDARKKVSTRRQLWEIDSHLLCSVCGTCLSMEEQRRLLRKLDIKERDCSDYEVHALMVRHGDHLNKISYQVNKLLNQKYRYDIVSYGHLAEEEFRALWEERHARGDVCGLYWVAVTHRGLADSFVQKAFCDIHMLSHLNGGKNRKEKAECGRMEEENRKLREKLLLIKRLRKEQEQELAAGSKRIKLLESKLSALEKPAEPEKDTPDRAVPDETSSSRRSIEKVDELRRELEQSFQLIRDLTRDKDSLSRELACQQNVNRQLYEEFQRMLKDLSELPPACQNAAREVNQCRRRILMVGGVTRLSAICREMVENMGHEFTYHDGYMNTGGNKLKNLIQNVDVVLCSTDCNSHGACQSVKKICKSLNKDCCFLSSTSLSSVFRVMKDINRANMVNGVSN